MSCLWQDCVTAKSYPQHRVFFTRCTFNSNRGPLGLGGDMRTTEGNSSSFSFFVGSSVFTTHIFTS